MYRGRFIGIHCKQTRRMNQDLRSKDNGMNIFQEKNKKNKQFLEALSYMEKNAVWFHIELLIVPYRFSVCWKSRAFQS